jgi:hypothetical protein
MSSRFLPFFFTTIVVYYRTMKNLFVNGTYRGEGRWVDQKTEGRYTALYTISEGEGDMRVHRAERTFLRDDGGVIYEEHSELTFVPAARNALQVTIASGDRTVTGIGYAFEDECHYEMDLAADNHLEFSFYSSGDTLTGVGSATNKGNFCSWRERLTRVQSDAKPFPN